MQKPRKKTIGSSTESFEKCGSAHPCTRVTGLITNLSDIHRKQAVRKMDIRYKWDSLKSWIKCAQPIHTQKKRDLQLPSITWSIRKYRVFDPCPTCESPFLMLGRSDMVSLTVTVLRGALPTHLQIVNGWIMLYSMSKKSWSISYSS